MDKPKRRGSRFTRWIARRLMSRSAAQALRIFAQTAARVPAYRQILDRARVDPRQIRRLADLTRVPVTSKLSLFATYPLSQLCLDGKLTDAVGVYTSSGFSGTYSFGAETYEDEARTRANIDRMFDLYFDARRRQMLVINALPAGVQTPSRLATVVNTSTRADAVLAMIDKMGAEFQQILIIAEHPFLKHVVERGIDSGLDWKKHVVHLVTGAEVMPEHCRIYLGDLLGHDPENPDMGQILVSLGISEVALSLGQETHATRAIRRTALEDATVHHTLFGDAPFLPSFVHFDPRQFYIENDKRSDGRPRVLITTLDPKRKIPLVRYTTDDWARVYTWEEVGALLRSIGREDLTPPHPLPCIAIWGRGESVRVGDVDVYPEHVKRAMYSEPAIAGLLTGDFQMRGEGDRLVARFQRNERPAASDHLDERLTALLKQHLNVQVDVTVEAFAEFRRDAAPSFEHKRRYIEHRPPRES
ncbi:MAG: hypothetical protein GC162_16375 [Planctomycetes bacterium]|nr:hypothetical protein [Planctomycetota bacterium]